MSYTGSLRIGLSRTDAAGVLFFAEQLALVHEVYEAWLREHDLAIGRMLRERSYALPIVRAETECLVPLRLDDEVAITLAVSRLGERSFTLTHALHRGEALAGRGCTVHVCIDPATGASQPLPEALRALCGRYLSEGSAGVSEEDAGTPSRARA